MKLEQNKQAALAVSRAIQAGVIRAKVDALITPDFRFHGSRELDRAGYVGFYEALCAAFPRMEMTFHQVIAEGDRVAIMFTTDTTHEGPFMNTPATGKPIQVRGQLIRRIEDGRVAEEWESVDMLGLLQQLGVAPTGH
jgi:steroid delta-isomerase-like uncharacterized protein